MNKLITTLCFVMLSAMSYAQQPCTWHENMENIDSVIATGNPGWFPNTRISYTGLQCDSSTIVAGGTSVLTTDPINLQNLFFVTLSFAHIARIDFFDAATVWASPDGGTTWTQLTAAMMDPSSQTDPAAFGGQGNIFSSGTSLDWDPANPGTVATNAMWHLDKFDISAVVGNSPNCLLQWRLADVSNPGPGGYPGWYLDDICVVAAACELNAPVITQLQPILQGNVYNLGPYDVNFDLVDASGILSANLTYTINNQPPGGTTVAMTLLAGNTYTAQIPAVNDGDTVCYSVTAIDNSGCNNASSYPTSGCIQFIASTGITFPYCDNFDVNNLWVDSGLVAGSDWQLGAPTAGWPNAAHSAPNCWEVNLGQPYANGTETYLYSPIFNFTTTSNASVDLWVNVQCENVWDGARLDYTTDNGVTWLVLGDQFSGGTNWYNSNALNSSGLPGWTGTSQAISGQPGWFNAKHSLNILNGVGNVQMRFAFTSDASVTSDGVAIDDICITEPSPQDAGVTQIIQPTGQAPAGSCLPVIFTMQNFGSQPITSTPITYVQTSGAGMPQTGTFNWTGNLAPGATITDTILPCFTVPAGAFCIQLYTSLPSDGNFFNDSTSMCGVGIPVLVPTICDDFESGNLGWVNSPAIGWQLGTPLPWAAHSPVNSWNTPSPYAPNAADTLYTPIYDVAAALNPNVSFWQNRNTEVGADGFRMEYELNSTGAWQTLGICNSDPNAIGWYNQCNLNFSAIPAWDGTTNGWVKSTYFLAGVAPFPGTNFIRFRFIFNSNFQNIQLSGVSVDDFCVTIPCANDVGPLSVNSYTQGLGGSPAAGTQDSVQVNIHNFGTSAQTSVTVTYMIDSAGVILFTSNPYVWNGNLTTSAPGWNSGTFVIPGSYTVPGGSYQIIVITSVTGDCDATNDTLQATGVGVPIIAIDYNTPYCDDFENGNVGWTVTFGAGGDPGSIWEFGLPAVAPTAGAHSGVNAWDINLTTQYNNNANVYLTSPIFDFTNAVDAKIDFWQNFSTENGWDGTHMEVSINNGPWTHFGAQQGQPTALNWYNCATINSNPGITGAWCGLSPGWQNAIWNNVSVNPQGLVFNNQPRVQFRYQFTSDASVQGIGYSIDDFCLTVPVPLTTTPTAVTDLPTTPHLNFPGQTICFRTTIKNDGTTPINTTAVQLVIDGLPVSLDTVTYTTPLAAGASQPYQFTTCWVGAPGFHTVCAITSYPNSGADLKPINDTICSTILIFDSAQIGTTAKCYDFETGPQWVDLNSINLLPTSSWTLGTPAKLNINTAHSGTNAWVTGGLTANYLDRDTSSLYSPLFIINGTLVYNLSFWTQFITEKNEDGGTVEYSTNYGVNWVQFGNQQDPNWMNTLDITALQIGAPGPVPHAGWSGNGLGWAQRDRDFCLGIQGTQNIIFRWRFNSDFSVHDEGWAIDDVCLTPQAAFCAVGVEEINDEFTVLQNAPNPFGDVTTISFSIKEKGYTELQILDITGQLVSVPLSKELGVGNYTINLSAGDLASGVYFYALKHNDTRIVKKMVVSK